LVVIQPFPLDLFTTTNNNNINISRKMANREQGEATSLYISCMMTIGVLRMQTTLLATTYRLFRLPGHDLAGREGGWRRDLKHAQRRKVQFLIQFTVTCRNSRTINWIGSSYPGVLVRLCAVRLRSD